MKKMFSLFLALSMIAAAIVAALPVSAAGFSDVEDGRWSAASVKYATDSGYMKGVGDGRFDPDGTLTRAAAVTVLWRRQGEPGATEPSGFVDVPADAWYADAVAWAREAGVTCGVSDEYFDPERPVTREQLAAMLFRYSEYAPVSVPERADLDAFSDGGSASDWSGEALGWAVEAELIEGTDETTLDPLGHATREQFAAMIERYDGSFRLAYNGPVLFSHYVEPECPLVDDADFYVSTTGDDGNDGSFDHPLRSWEAARDAVRALDKTGRDGITVAFMAGDYGPLSITLTEEDSGTADCPITYCKYGDGDVVFNNGFDFTEDSFEPISENEKALFPSKSADSVKKLDLSSVLSSGLSPDDVILFYRGGMCWEARFPNKFDDNTDDLLYAAAYGSADTLVIINAVLARRIAKYSDDVFRTMKIYGYIKAGYNKHTYRVAGYDPETAILTVDERDVASIGKMRDWLGVTGLGIELCVSNVSYELDRKGEYWIDPDTETMYVYSPEGDYFIPSGGTMVTMDGVNDVTFRGLTFRNSAGGFIDASMCHGATLELCSFKNTSAMRGVNFEDNSLERPMALTVRECTFENAYGQALFVEGNNVGEHRFDKREDIVFDNNLVRTTNMVYDAYNGISFEACAGVTVTHNRFEECSRGAVFFGQSYDILIEYNDFHSAMCNSHDGGVVYTDWICDARNFVVRYNLFGYVPTVGAGQFGLYLDEFTSGTEIYSNVFYKTGNSAVMYSLGRDNVFHDNVVICDEFNAAVGFGTATRDEIEEYGSPEAAEAAGSWGMRHGKRIWGEMFYNVANYPAYRAVVEERWPDMLNIHFDTENIDDPYFALNQVTLVKDNVYVGDRDEAAYRTDRKYPAMYTKYEGNAAYQLGENPIFVNPTVGDYRIRDGVDFPDIQFEKIGRY